jgi:hypothetical protein
MRRGRRSSVAACLALLIGATGSPAAATSYGSIRAADGTLRHGCHAHHYRYAVEPPTGDWTLETWLHDPRGKKRGYGYFLVGGDPEKGRSSFTICSRNVVPGRFTITARLTWYDDPVLPLLPATEHVVRLATAHFRLSRP